MGTNFEEELGEFLGGGEGEEGRGIFNPRRVLIRHGGGQRFITQRIGKGGTADTERRYEG